MKQFDVVAIGSGEAGEVPAMMCAEQGMRVALAEQSDPGGTCALRGCNPKRALANAAELVIRSRAMNDLGVAGSLTLKWTDLFKHRRNIIEGIPEKMEQRLADAGIDLLRGHCSFERPDTLRIGNRVVAADHIVVATGAAPRSVDFPGAEYLTSTDELLESNELPDRVIFVGAGYISMEFATVLSMAGVQTTLLEMLPRPLTGFDGDLVDLARPAWEEQGLKIHTNITVRRIERRNRELVVYDSEEHEYRAAMVVHGAGRVPNIGGMNLAGAGITTHKDRPQLNEFLQSVGNNRVYFAGDAASRGPQLTPVAEIDGRVVGANIIGGPHECPDYSSVASCLFTMPGLARVGENDTREVRDRGIEVVFKDTSGSHSTRRLGLSRSGFKALIDRNSDTLAGIHLLGHNVDEVINAFSLAIREKTSLSVLKRLGATFPSVTYDTVMRL